MTATAANARLLGCTLRLGAVVRIVIYGARYGANGKCSSVAEARLPNFSDVRLGDGPLSEASLVHTSTWYVPWEVRVNTEFLGGCSAAPEDDVFKCFCV
jgi:hypothetical protein